MFELTGLDRYDWLVLGLFLSGAGLLWLALAPGVKSAQARYRRIIPFIGGLIAVLLSVVAQPERSAIVFLDAVTSVPSAIFVGALAAIVFSSIWALDRWLLPRLSRALSRHGRVSYPTANDLLMGTLVALIAGISLWALFTVDPERGQAVPPLPSDPVANAPFQFEWRYQTPGHPMAVAYHEPTRSLFVTIGEGQILRYGVQPGLGGLDPPEVLVTGLKLPRGAAVLGDRLYVVETGDLACELVALRCKYPDVDADAGLTLGSLEAQVLSDSRSRILDYAIGAEGTLSEVGTLLGDLPTVNTDHGVNGLYIGSDGFLYVAIGNVDVLIYYRDELAGVTHPNLDLVGTVLRIDVNNGSYEVVSDGLRNVFGLTADPTGILWGVDNDGGSWRGIRREELLRIVDGARFGFPHDGSAPPFEVRTDPAAYTFAQGVVGSAGISWVRDVEGAEGVLTGSIGRLSFLRLALIAGVYMVPEAIVPVEVVPINGVPVSITQVGPQAAVYAEYGANQVALLTWR